MLNVYEVLMKICFKLMKDKTTWLQGKDNTDWIKDSTRYFVHPRVFDTQSLPITMHTSLPRLAVCVDLIMIRSILSNTCFNTPATSRCIRVLYNDQDQYFRTPALFHRILGRLNSKALLCDFIYTCRRIAESIASSTCVYD